MARDRTDVLKLFSTRAELDIRAGMLLSGEEDAVSYLETAVRYYLAHQVLDAEATETDQPESGREDAAVSVAVWPTLREQVLRILVSADGDPLAPKAIAKSLTEEGRLTSSGTPVSTRHVQNTLADLADTEEAINIGRGQWVAASTVDQAIPAIRRWRNEPRAEDEL